MGVGADMGGMVGSYGGTFKFQFLGWVVGCFGRWGFLGMA